ncbi:hypothetical protein HDU92_004192 [Lobulomyces angularis]|nr:hypothetical protein HDU92_004192 [Lobulomyces angularis]
MIVVTFTFLLLIAFTTQVPTKFTFKTTKNHFKVFLAADFNKWSTTDLPLNKNSDSWSVIADIDRTLQHQYKYVVDGVWTLDSDSPQITDKDGFRNNLLLALSDTSISTTATKEISTSSELTTSQSTAVSSATPTTIISLNNPLSTNAKNVFLAGEFNNWSSTSLKANFNAKWSVSLTLNRSIPYQYKFVVDGVWTLDSSAPTINDGKGNINNLLPATGDGDGNLPDPLPGCETFDGLDFCKGSETNYPESVDIRKWQTPPKNSSEYSPAYQSYRDLTGWATIQYAEDYKSATVIVNTFTRDPNASVLYSFNNAPATESNKIQVDTTFTTSLFIQAKIANTMITLDLDPLNFLWQNLPVKSNFDGQKGAIVELLGWPYKDIELECEFLGRAGYMGVKVWPVNEHVHTFNDLQKNEVNNWYYVYQPVSYRLTGRFGTRDELKSMIKTCRSHGVRVYIDAVINHMTEGYNSNYDQRGPQAGDNKQCNPHGPKNSTGGSPYFTHNQVYKYNVYTRQRPALEYPAVPYGPTHFHCERKMDEWENAFEVTKGWLEGKGGLTDLDTGSPYVQGRIADFLVDLFSIGVSGFRVDAAKHIGPQDMSKILAALKQKLGGNFPPDFISWMEILMGPGGEADVFACKGNDNWYLAFNKYMKQSGLNDNDIQKVKIWSADYPANFPICGNWVIDPSRFIIQNDDHDNTYFGGRYMGTAGSVLSIEKDVNKHRNFEKLLFNRRDQNWLIRNLLSGYSFTDQMAVGYPDGKSDCSLYTGKESGCKTVPFTKAYIADSCGYSVIKDGKWIPNRYTRTHRDISVINAMRGWMGLPIVNASDLKLPTHCT